MKRSERKQLAKRIAVLESIIQANLDQEAVESAKNEIMNLTSRSEISLEDMAYIDEMVQKKLEKNK